MTDIAGPANAPNATTSRPTDARVFGASNTWFQDCTSPTTEDGTLLQAAFLNGLLAQIRDAIEQAGVTQDNADDMLTRAIRALSPGVPVGSMINWPTNTAPAGWLKRNGAAISRTTYSGLFAILGTSFGPGDGSTTFNLMDDRGLFERGWDDGRGIDTGRVFGSEQTDLIRSHTHDPAAGMSNFVTRVTGDPVIDIPSFIASPTYDYSFAPATGGVSAGLGGAETRPRNRAYLPIIKF